MNVERLIDGANSAIYPHLTLIRSASADDKVNGFIDFNAPSAKESRTTFSDPWHGSP